MKVLTKTILIQVALLFGFYTASSQDGLSVKLEELTAPDFVKAVELSGGTAIIATGVIEKHAAHLPLGADMFVPRVTALRAAEQEYTIVFPLYYVGQMFEGRNQPGNISYSTDLILGMLQETCDELARNGIKKIVIVNGHGGNNFILRYFCQQLLEKERDYVVMVFEPSYDEATEKKIYSILDRSKDGHAGQGETSMLRAINDDLVHMDRTKDQPGKDLKRLEELDNAFTSIWWYASFPDYYEGDGSGATKELGNLMLNHRASQLAKLIKKLKNYDTIGELQERYHREAREPLKTKQPYQD